MEAPLKFLQKTIIHYVGSKKNLDPLLLSDKEVDIEEETTQLLQDNFLKRFKDNTEYYSFTHSASLEFNEVYQYAKKLFADATGFEEVSASIAKHLYDQSTHPKVKGGELYIAYFDGLPVESRVHKALGLFKAENKSLFLEVQQQKKGLDLQMREGIEPAKMDKGCLIINNKQDEGFDVLIFDNQSRGEEAQYWKEKFLGLTPQQNEYHHTANLMALTKQFITGPLETELKVPRTEQVELLHRSLDYFKTNETFDINDFQKEVFHNEEHLTSFRQFGSQYIENTGYDIAASFDISADAVKKGSRVYKSVLKLDKNFHIYIHGRTDLIERGTDIDGRKYYKIYYQEER
jgi:hypothetical protein